MRGSLLALAASMALLSACGAANPPAEVVDSVAACNDSHEASCDNGRPLCLIDGKRACRFCRCSTYSMAQPIEVPDQYVSTTWSASPVLNPALH